MNLGAVGISGLVADENNIYIGSKYAEDRDFVELFNFNGENIGYLCSDIGQYAVPLYVDSDSLIVYSTKRQDDGGENFLQKWNLEFQKN
ncbi:MAG: hypothetical protein ACLFPL_04090 [Candidatus Nanoarchaeia archaeon]